MTSLESFRERSHPATGRPRAGVGHPAVIGRATPPPTQPSPTRGEGLNLAPSPLVGEGWGGGTLGIDPTRERPRMAWAPTLLLAAVALVIPPAALAQDKPAAKAAGVFDEEEKKKPADTKPAKAVDPTKPIGAALERDSIGFTQENAAAQMTELEERMFRLSEALRSLEPENASRLGLALKFSREELILNQMKETHTLLKDAQLGKAETEVRELIAKLNHLRDLLLAENLDFQMKLARLRQMREALAQLDRIIKEEKRELAWSRAADEQQAELAKIKNRRPDLEGLVQAQKDVIADSKLAGKKEGEADRKAGREANRDRETNLRASAASLAADPLFAALAPPHLKQSDPHLGDAVTHLGTTDVDSAVVAEEKALDEFRKELDRLGERASKGEEAVAAPEFRKFEQDQLKNRKATNTLAAVSARLGDAGVALQKDLIRASEPMESAEGDLAKAAAKPAAEDQFAALKLLSKSREGLARSLEGLLTEIRTELQARIVAELTEMHESQVAIREITEAQAPRVAQKSRTAFIMVASQSEREAELADKTDQLTALTEETEFGVALPTALRVISRQMKVVQGALKKADASPATVKLETRIEQDLLGLLEAMRRLPPTTPPPPGTPLPTDLRARERELNRLVAELKMIRLLQVRLDDDTVQVDQTRPSNPVLPLALRREIETLKSGQDEIRDSLKKISKSLEPDKGPAVDFGPLPGLDQ